MANEKALSNVCLVQIVTEEETPKLISLDTATEMNIDPKTSEGSEEILRVKNRLIAQTSTEDLVLGYDLTHKDATFTPENFALIDGGTLVETGDNYSYDGPQTGVAVNRTRFTMDVWTEEKDADGATIGYDRFRFKHCKGTPVKFAHKDGGFFAPEYTIKSRAKKGERPLNLASFAELPGSELTAAQVLAYTGE